RCSEAQPTEKETDLSSLSPEWGDILLHSIALAGLTMRVAFVSVGCASLHLRLIKYRLCEALGVLLRIVIIFSTIM
ncbi:MAG: hypothetical protein LBO74_03565, partial [Candidatus Symbiothrix sp.]|nr:hypothetical protein [Candidatus Symbiothrix sp.]